ncbi:hypothetical protein PMAYCL1PPCAC_13378, partial [Pristionchus mayeri]
HLLPLALLLAGTAAYYDTVLEKKCMALKRNNENAAYVNGICFVACKDKKKVSHATWTNLQEECRQINGYKGQLAYIPDRAFTRKLFKTGLLTIKNKYYIGARQFPIPDCSENGGTCKDDDQRKNWFFFDEKNKQIAAVEPELWVDGEPGNQEVPETVAVLERFFSFDNYAGGLNDMNPDKGEYQPLCQFTDYLKCDDGYILIRDKCYKQINTNAANAAQSKKKCEEEGAVLASMNAIIIDKSCPDFSRDNNRTVDQPIRFGLSYGDSWVNDDGTPVDFFRWWDQAGCGIPIAFTGGNVRVALIVSGKARNADPSYWTVTKDEESYPFLCQKNPTKAYDSV